MLLWSLRISSYVSESKTCELQTVKACRHSGVIYDWTSLNSEYNSRYDGETSGGAQKDGRPKCERTSLQLRNFKIRADIHIRKKLHSSQRRPTTATNFERQLVALARLPGPVSGPESTCNPQPKFAKLYPGAAKMSFRGGGRGGGGYGGARGGFGGGRGGKSKCCHNAFNGSNGYC